LKLAKHPGKIAGVINVGVGQDNGVGFSSGRRQLIPVFSAEFFPSLEKPAVHHQLEGFPLEQIFRSRHTAAGAKYSQFHIGLLPCSWYREKQGNGDGCAISMGNVVE